MSTLNSQVHTPNYLIKVLSIILVNSNINHKPRKKERAHISSNPEITMQKAHYLKTIGFHLSKVRETY